MHAKQALAKLYLANLGETEHAMPIFMELASWKDEEGGGRIFETSCMSLDWSANHSSISARRALPSNVRRRR